MIDAPLRLVGITRFGLRRVSPGGADRGWADWSHRAGGPDTRPRAYMDYRLTLLRTFAAPTMRALRVPRGFTYDHVVVTHEGWPHSVMDDLSDLLDTVPNSALVVVPPDHGFKSALRTAISQLCVGDAPAGRFTFRLDDDDALHPAFLEDVAAQQWRAGRVFSPDYGYHMAGVRGGLSVIPRTSPLIAIGLGFIHPTHTIHDLGLHTAIPDAVPMRRRPYWLRTIHAVNDSRVTFNRNRKHRGNPEAVLAEHFPHINAADAALILSRRAP